MRFFQYIKEMADTDDWGATGKKFERTFLKACELVGLKFEKNVYAGKLWDFHPKGKGWSKILSNEDVNIKVYGTKWMFASRDIYDMLPWEELPEDFDAKKAATKLKRYFNKHGLNKIVFLKPKSKEIQSEIANAVKIENIERLNELLVRKNFLAEKLDDYKVRVLHNEKRVTSVVIDHGGKVFMRSEKPRRMGGSENMVAFRTPTPKISKQERKVKVK